MPRIRMRRDNRQRSLTIGRDLDWRPGLLHRHRHRPPQRLQDDTTREGWELCLATGEDLHLATRGEFSFLMATDMALHPRERGFSDESGVRKRSSAPHKEI
jgi:hypothetical protein